MCRGKKIRWEDMSEDDESDDEDEQEQESRRCRGGVRGGAQDGVPADGEGAQDDARPVEAPGVGDLITVLWTEEGDGGVWFRARVKEVDEASMTVEYTHVGEGWKDFVHKWGTEAWEHWTADSVPDPAEAAYRLDRWVGEVDVEARRASLNARRGAGDRGERRRRRGEAAKEREAGDAAGSSTEGGSREGSEGRAGGEDQERMEVEEDSAEERSEEARADGGGGVAAPKPKTVAGKLWRMLRHLARGGQDQLTKREIYKLAAREGLKPTAKVSKAITQLGEWGVLMVGASGCDVVQWLESDEDMASDMYMKAEKGEVETSEKSTGSTAKSVEHCARDGRGDDADMLRTGEPLRDGPGGTGGQRSDSAEGTGGTEGGESGYGLLDGDEDPDE